MAGWVPGVLGIAVARFSIICLRMFFEGLQILGGFWEPFFELLGIILPYLLHVRFCIDFCNVLFYEFGKCLRIIFLVLFWHIFSN